MSCTCKPARVLLHRFFFLQVSKPGILHINNSRHLARKYARIFVHGNYLFRDANSFLRAKLEENCELQIMSKDKYPSMFSPQMETIVFIILQIFFATRTIFKVGEYSRIFPSFSWGIFGHVTRLDQSRMSEKIWWIIRSTTNFTLSYIWKNTCTMCSSRKYPYSPHRGDWNFLGDGGFCKAKKFKEMYEA